MPFDRTQFPHRADVKITDEQLRGLRAAGVARGHELRRGPGGGLSILVREAIDEWLERNAPSQGAQPMNAYEEKQEARRERLENREALRDVVSSAGR